MMPRRYKGRSWWNWSVPRSTQSMAERRKGASPPRPHTPPPPRATLEQVLVMSQVLVPGLAASRGGRGGDVLHQLQGRLLKTTTSWYAASYANLGYQVLFVDLDPRRP